MSNKRVFVAAMVGVGLAAAACGSSSSGGGGGSTPTSTSTAGNVNVVISATSFTRDFSAMTKLKAVTAAGKGKVGVILPDTVSSARYVEFDAPYLKQAFEKAGLSSSQFTIQNAQGSTQTQVTDAEAAITGGATVLVVDPLDSGTGSRIEKYAAQHGAQVIDYDRLTLGGDRGYYISFNNVNVGRLIGTGFANCVKQWNVSHPKFIKMVGDPTDNNATLFADGYNAVIKPYVSSGKWTQAAAPPGTWDPPTALKNFQQAFTANSGVNSAIIPNDENAAPIINWLANRGVKAKSFPITGQDATLVGLQNILSGYQCGTVYKPIYLEAQAAAAVALYLRAGLHPPAALVNGLTKDSQENKNVPSVLLTPTWVTTANMNDTVIADEFVPAKQLCTSKYAADCKAAGISTG
jgi:D-xylose transport system substrate-binding protein